MHIPRIWTKASADGRFPEGRTLPVSVWGWGDDEPQAKRTAAERLHGVLERIRRGEPFPERYGYAGRPLREEILQTVGSPGSGGPAAVLTRNSYGAQVLNTARLLFLDVDLSPATLLQRLRRVFGGVSPEDAALARLREVLGQDRHAAHRVYRTASGLRVMAIGREFDPAGPDVQDLMRATGTDPAFSRLCLAQRSFRARLTPKPWRCHSPLPPGQHPRRDAELQRRFLAWLSEYEQASRRYATCRYLETIGNGSPTGDARRVLELHDRATRSDEPLPLA